MKQSIPQIGLCIVVFLSMIPLHAQTLYFKVESANSYVKDTGSRLLTHNPPLKVNLDEGGYLIMTVNPGKKTLEGRGYNLTFTTDKCEQSSLYNLTGKMQTIFLKLSQLELTYDPTSGNITSSTGSTSIYGDKPLWPGSLALWYSGASKLIDANSSTIDFANGLGICNGQLILEVGSGNPTDFYIKIIAKLWKEDLDGDGKYETLCKVPIWKDLELLYDPPLITVIIPSRFREISQNADQASLQMINLKELIARAIEQTGQEPREEPVSVLNFENAEEFSIVLLNIDGQVIAGDFSDRSSKEINFNPVEGESSRIGILSGLRMVEEYHERNEK